MQVDHRVTTDVICVHRLAKCWLWGVARYCVTCPSHFSHHRVGRFCGGACCILAPRMKLLPQWCTTPHMPKGITAVTVPLSSCCPFPKTPSPPHPLLHLSLSTHPATEMGNMPHPLPCTINSHPTARLAHLGIWHPSAADPPGAGGLLVQAGTLLTGWPRPWLCTWLKAWG